MPVGVHQTPCDESNTITLTVDDHDCNPRLLQFFEPDSQHVPPFQR